MGRYKLHLSADLYTLPGYDQPTTPLTTTSPLSEELLAQLASADTSLILSEPETEPVADSDDEFRKARTVLVGEFTGCPVDARD